LDVLNKNGWGIPSSDADNVISSLRNAVIRVCSRDSPHGCDLSEDPKAEIGRVLTAWNDNGLVRTTIDITDSIATRKLRDGVWPYKWSVYAKSKKLKISTCQSVDQISRQIICFLGLFDTGKCPLHNSLTVFTLFLKNSVLIRSKFSFFCQENLFDSFHNFM